VSQRLQLLLLLLHRSLVREGGLNVLLQPGRQSCQRCGPVAGQQAPNTHRRLHVRLTRQAAATTKSSMQFGKRLWCGDERGRLLLLSRCGASPACP
jgi:hypothetical protein